MKTHDLKFDGTKLNAELFYSAFLSLPNNEKENFLSRLFNGISAKSVAITTNGKPLSKHEYSKHIEMISQDVKSGNYISHENILNELEDE